MQLFFFKNPKVTVNKGAETIQGRKLFKGGNYMRKYGMWKMFMSQNVHILDTNVFGRQRGCPAKMPCSKYLLTNWSMEQI